MRAGALADGGLNYDTTAYSVPDECQSSLVGTMPALEAMLLGDLAGEQRVFVDRARERENELRARNSSAHGSKTENKGDLP